MTTTPTHRRNGVRVAALTAAGTSAMLLALAAPAAAAQPDRPSAPPAQDVPAAGASVPCRTVGTLTGTSGVLRQQETSYVDRSGRTHVLFTIAARSVRLIGTGGSTYRLIGGGFDYVVYPGRTITGRVDSEKELFRFDVVGPQGVAGVVRFSLHTGADQIPHVHDTSTCQLPGMA